MSRAVAIALLAALLPGSSLVLRAQTQSLLGSLSGEVRNPQGVTQMGAVVFLMNRNERVIQKALTDPDGRFRFEGLPADRYSVRVALNSYVPAQRSGVPVIAGLDSFLNVQLATLFSSIELVYAAPGQVGLLSDDWKWVLRSSSAIRPVLRFMDPAYTAPGLNPRAESKVFSATRALVRLSGGDVGGSSMLGSEADLGTAFALATSVYGGNQISVAGNLGYSSISGGSAAGLRTRYVRTGQGAVTPEVELTVRQLNLGQRAGMGLLSGPGAAMSAPQLRSMAVRLQDHLEIVDGVTLDYGVLLEAVVFLDRLTSFSPYARLTTDLGELGIVEVAYSSGAPAIDLLMTRAPGEIGMQSELAGLALFPRISLADGRARLQRNDTYEAGYMLVRGGRAYSVSTYYDNLRNSAMAASGDPGYLNGADLLPDIASSGAIFNLGSYRAFGTMGSVSQRIGGEWSVTAAGGFGTGLAPGAAPTSMEIAAAQLRSNFQGVQTPWAGARIAGIIPRAGTLVSTSYTWAPSGTLAPVHAYLTQRWQPMLGLNLQLRQPLPTMGMPGRWEMNAEMRNLLAQGYVPVASGDGARLLLLPYPRLVRGGLSFIF